VRGQHARRRIGEHIVESRARHGDEVVAVGATALAQEQQSLGVAGTAERHVVDEALSRLMPQIHRPLFRRRGNVLLIDSGSIALNPCDAVSRGALAGNGPATPRAERLVAHRGPRRRLPERTPTASHAGHRLFALEKPVNASPPELRVRAAKALKQRSRHAFSADAKK
jgi:hypothetical protein